MRYHYSLSEGSSCLCFKGTLIKKNGNGENPKKRSAQKKKEDALTDKNIMVEMSTRTYHNNGIMGGAYVRFCHARTFVMMKPTTRICPSVVLKLRKYYGQRGRLGGLVRAFVGTMPLLQLFY